MKHFFSAMAVAAASLALLAGCAVARGGDGSLASPGEPHAIISTAMPPNPGHFWAQIVWLDGDYLSNPDRSAYWVEPGTHKIGFRANIDPERAVGLIYSPATTQPVDMPVMELDLEAGYTYYFAADVPQGSIMPSDWQPILIKKVKTGGD
ncbi:MAG: hypothetical protein L0I62_09470 [Gammaproteobacteria bacterium]|nr:hypothetical protein [Gammaproteobacteria bacterium]